jgi:tetratricopeptide (TPR) repeat protein
MAGSSLKKACGRPLFVRRGSIMTSERVIAFQRRARERALCSLAQRALSGCLLVWLLSSPPVLIASNPEAEESHRRALEFVSAGNASAAEVEFRRAWELERTEPKYVHDVTMHYIHLKKYSEALDVIRDSVKRSGPTALAWTLQGEVLFQQKLYDAAYQSLRSALDVNNDNYRAHELIGLIFSLNHRHMLGLEELKIAVQQNPGSAQAHFYCGRLYYQTGNYAASRDEFLECLKLDSFYPQALENLGLAYEGTGDPGQSAALYQQAIDLGKRGKTPPSDFPYVCLAVLVYRQGEQARARDLLRQALAINPNSAWANFELGRILFQAGEDRTAEQHLQRAAKLDPNYSRPHFLLGKLYQHTGRSSEATRQFDTFQKLDKEPDNRQPQITR